MFKQKLVCEVKGKEERVAKFECDPQAPLGEVHDALYEIKSFIINQINQRHKQEVPQEKADVKAETNEEEAN